MSTPDATRIRQPIRVEQHPTPADLLRFNQRTYRRHPIMEAEASLLRAWRLYRTWESAGETA